MLLFGSPIGPLEFSGLQSTLIHTGDVTVVLQQPTMAVPVGRAVYRLGTTNATQTGGLQGHVRNTSNYITAGQDPKPVFEYNSPELAFGGPLFPYFAKGSGPYLPGTIGISPPASDIVAGHP